MYDIFAVRSYLTYIFSVLCTWNYLFMTYLIEHPGIHEIEFNDTLKTICNVLHNIKIIIGIQKTLYGVCRNKKVLNKNKEVIKKDNDASKQKLF